MDQHAATLADMEAEKKTLAEMLTWLRDEGVTCSASTLSRFLESQRQAHLQDKLLAQIASGARQCQAVEKQFGQNPAPDLETLIKLHRVLTLQLSTQGNADPELLKLADQLLRTAMEFVSGQTKAAHKERELKLAEEKFQLDFCEKILDQAMRDSAERIANSNLSNADKIAAMRKEAFKSVDELQASGKVVIPK
ncbi:hypothetical protein [Silvimonas sp.]|uniref:hypothetical protein n=1 Tax=Silvimonas sp. TaxID=2650811 RepID=UPI002850E71A|nr:hypothetical protein [Silvimonas sp.]MDR3427845.1 hypothetical protein [Silvimonas sp.]